MLSVQKILMEIQFVLRNYFLDVNMQRLIILREKFIARKIVERLIPVMWGDLLFLQDGGSAVSSSSPADRVINLSQCNDQTQRRSQVLQPGSSTFS